jgi:hypothetical protein
MSAFFQPPARFSRMNHIWIGISSTGVAVPLAHLMEYVPETKSVFDRGDVVTQLKRSRLYRKGEGQMKIHSKIVQAQDGYLYFASMDEQGEATDGSRLPIWGSHLWRIHPEGGDWEHLLAVPEALIAVSGVGRYIYALGYFGHMLYQYNRMTGEVRSVRVGAEGGHISRNFLADMNNHVYVPRLIRVEDDPNRMATTLVEFDDQLRELAETPIYHYTQTRDDDSHGIIGILYLADRSLVFATDQGFLYKITPRRDGPAVVGALGFLHSAGEAYVASLFAYDGKSELVGVSQSKKDPSRFDWLVFDLRTSRSKPFSLELPSVNGHPPMGIALYGSITRDNAGLFYLGGTYGEGDRSRPILLKARPRG